MKWIAGALSLLLGGVVAVEWLVWEVERPEIVVRTPPENRGSGPVILDAEGGLELAPIGEYQVIEQRPLFIEGRRPVEPPAKHAPPAPPPQVRNTPAPVLDLRGILVINGQRTAFLGRPVEKEGEKRLVVGSVVRGWRVAAIEADRLILSSNGEESVVELRKFANVPLPATAPGRPPIPTPARPAPVVRKHGAPPIPR